MDAQHNMLKRLVIIGITILISVPMMGQRRNDTVLTFKSKNTNITVNFSGIKRDFMKELNAALKSDTVKELKEEGKRLIDEYVDPEAVEDIKSNYKELKEEVKENFKEIKENLKNN